MDEKEQEFYTVEEVSSTLRCHPNSVRKWIKLKKIHAVMIGERWLIPVAELKRLKKGE